MKDAFLFRQKSYYYKTCVWAHTETTSYHRNIRLFRTWLSLTLKSATHHKVAGSCEAKMSRFSDTYTR